jgi:hypothetical protein
MFLSIRIYIVYFVFPEDIYIAYELLISHLTSFILVISFYWSMKFNYIFPTTTEI